MDLNMGAIELWGEEIPRFPFISMQMAFESDSHLQWDGIPTRTQGRFGCNITGYSANLTANRLKSPRKLFQGRQYSVIFKFLDGRLTFCPWACPV